MFVKVPGRLHIYAVIMSFPPSSQTVIDFNRRFIHARCNVKASSDTATEKEGCISAVILQSLRTDNHKINSNTTEFKNPMKSQALLIT